MINTADYSKTPNRARRTNIENPQGGPALQSAIPRSRLKGHESVSLGMRTARKRMR
jgi:hypothetical protein